MNDQSFQLLFQFRIIPELNDQKQKIEKQERRYQYYCKKTNKQEITLTCAELIYNFTSFGE